MTTQILVLCTGNSCRSILAEALLNRKGYGRVLAFSAGSKPAGRVNPNALALLQRKGYETANLSSKSWDIFHQPDAPHLDLVITVCGNAAGETCPIFHGPAKRGHWGIADPADATGTEMEIQSTFEEAYRLLELRVDAFLESKFETFSEEQMTAHLLAIGAMEGAA